MKTNAPVSIAAVLLILLGPADPGKSAEMPGAREYTNATGMKLVRVEPGNFLMGQSNSGEWDEQPVHTVKISRAFYMAATEVTNAQYEQFDPSHRRLRGKHGLSKADDEAVIYVSWHEAAAFCQWLSDKTALPYRLPTEAEWEYACRAGTSTAFHTGDELPETYHKNQSDRKWTPVPVSLKVAVTPPNTWGLHDMHGSVEEWCSDWYGPYDGQIQTDPVGRIAGHIKVTRGGSHGAKVHMLRSANRQGTLPEDKHWLIGFRVVLGKQPKTTPLGPPPQPTWARDVSQKRHNWSKGPDADKPYFAGPISYQNVPRKMDGPLFGRHNHCPAITWCPNGDVLAVWFSCRGEETREMTIAGSRLKAGTAKWCDPSEFFNAPDRNMTGSALLTDDKGMLYYFNGVSAAHGYRTMNALIMSTSNDNGLTWAHPRLINPNRNDPQRSNQPIASVFISRNGTIFLPSDAPLRRDDQGNRTRGSALWISKDRGQSWAISAGTIAGIHTAAVELDDGSLFAFGRGQNIDGKMPMSISTNLARTWEHLPSEFPKIGGGQRLVLRRLREGPILFGSFAQGDIPIMVTDTSGNKRPIKGFFVALSYDQGKTWPVKRLVSHDRDKEEKMLNGRPFRMTAAQGEPKGYFACTQSPDGMIHLISSKNYYAFNLKWIETPPPAEVVISSKQAPAREIVDSCTG